MATRNDKIFSRYQSRQFPSKITQLDAKEIFYLELFTLFKARRFFWLSVDTIRDACRLRVASGICRPACDAVATLTRLTPDISLIFLYE